MSSVNNILNTLLQRKFKVTQKCYTEFFISIMEEIDFGVPYYVRCKLDIINSEIDIKKELLSSTLNINNIDEFVKALMIKDEGAIDFLHNLVNKYVTNERNKYVKENFDYELSKNTKRSRDNSKYIGYMIHNYPVELIVDILTDIGDYSAYLFSTLTKEEFDLILNKELVKELVLYRRNPDKYGKISKELKENLKIFRSLCNKLTIELVTSEDFKSIEINDSIKLKNPIYDDFIVDILKYLDMDLLKKDLFNDEEMLDKLRKIWNQYKLCCWKDNFDDLLEESMVDIREEVIANFIQYFKLSYNSQKMKNSDLPISFIELLDEASCYCKDSEKYSYIFGKEDFNYIATNPRPYSASMLKSKRIKNALELFKEARERNFITVPPVDEEINLSSNKKIRVVLGNFSNPINLTYGERTGSCMRIGCNAESLLKFCIENENGFHIRFVNPGTGKFITRVSGFRNGNTIVLNQLRFSLDNAYDSYDLIEACEILSKKLIELTKENTYPIENVVITKDFAMVKSDKDEVQLGVSNIKEGLGDFYCDIFNNYGVVLASSRPNNELVEVKLEDTSKEKYKVLRDDIRRYYDKECYEQIMHILYLDDVLEGINIEDINHEISKDIIFCVVGEDWYISVDKDHNIDTYMMRNSLDRKTTQKEMEEALYDIKNSIKLDNKNISR